MGPYDCLEVVLYHDMQGSQGHRAGERALLRLGDVGCPAQRRCMSSSQLEARLLAMVCWRPNHRSAARRRPSVVCPVASNPSRNTRSRLKPPLEPNPGCHSVVFRSGWFTQRGAQDSSSFTSFADPPCPTLKTRHGSFNVQFAVTLFPPHPLVFSFPPTGDPLHPHPPCQL